MNFLWLGGVFDEKTVNKFPSMSPASNFWQRGFIDALKNQGHNVQVIGHPLERVWPFGRLFVHAAEATFPDTFTGRSLSYINAPLLRVPVLIMNYWMKARRQIMSVCPQDYLVTFSCLTKATDWAPTISAARNLRKLFNIPWICIVADGVSPPGADGYVYLTWGYYNSAEALSPKMHLDGGIPSKCERANDDPSEYPKAFMYMGALTQHGGVTFLARSFHRLTDKNVELWVCGRGENNELESLASIDNRIKLMGFVSEAKLDELANMAYAFINPRPSDFAPNTLNYPSKLLHYLAYGKPVISTWTEGLSPEYRNLLVQVVDETEKGLVEAMQVVLNMTDKERRSIAIKTEEFNESHAWPRQVDRFIAWLRTAT